MISKDEQIRNFGGKTGGFDDNRDRHFHQRMLKAYIKGKEYFNFGFDGIGFPKSHKVLVKWV